MFFCLILLKGLLFFSFFGIGREVSLGAGGGTPQSPSAQAALPTKPRSSCTLEEHTSALSWRDPSAIKGGSVMPCLLRSRLQNDSGESLRLLWTSQNTGAAAETSRTNRNDRFLPHCTCPLLLSPFSSFPPPGFPPPSPTGRPIRNLVVITCQASATI